MLTSQAHAKGASIADAARALTVGAGISAPSTTTALYENPAALIFNDRIRIQGIAHSNDSDLSPLGIGGGAYLGNGLVGAGLQALTGNTFHTTLRYGAGAYIDGLRLALGVAGGSSVVSKSGGLPPGSSHSTQAGLLFFPYEALTFGAVAYGIDRSLDAMGAGLSAMITHGATLTIDAGAKPSFNGVVIKPGLAIWLSEFQFSYSYGHRVDHKAAAALIEGTTLGFGLAVNDRVHLQAYYNQLAQYSAAITFKF